MTTFTLGIIKVVPSLTYNLFSINTVLDKNFDLSADKNKYQIIKANFQLIFDQKFTRGNSFLMGVKIQPRMDDARAVGMENGAKISYHELHT